MRLDDTGRIAAIRMLCRHGYRPRVALRGTSMLPMLHEPMILELEGLARRPRIGEIIVFEQDDRLTAHRVVGLRSGDRVFAAGDAVRMAPDVIKPSRMVGKVARVWSSTDPHAKRVDGPLFRLRGVLYAYRRMIRIAIYLICSAFAKALLAVNVRRRPRASHALFGVLQAIVRADAPALRSRLASIDGRTLLQVARRQRCAAILADGLEELGIADSVAPHLRRTLRAERWSATLRAVMLRRQVDDIVTLLRPHGITPILLKGAARACRAESRCDRHVSHDIDLLLRSSDLDTAERVLRDAGYRQLEDERQFARHHHRAPLFPPGAGLPVEIHHALAKPGTLSVPTDARSLASRIRYFEGATGTIGVLDDVTTALHLAIHARDLNAPLRDLVLLAQRLRALSDAEREELRGIIDSAGAERLRLHAMVHAAAQLANVAWETPRGARRYFEWRLRRDDLPTPLRQRSFVVDAFVAGGPKPAFTSLLTYRDRVGHRFLGRTARLVVHVAWRIVTTFCVVGYAFFMKDPPTQARRFR